MILLKILKKLIDQYLEIVAETMFTKNSIVIKSLQIIYELFVKRQLTNSRKKEN